MFGRKKKTESTQKRTGRVDVEAKGGGAYLVASTRTGFCGYSVKDQRKTSRSQVD